MLLFVLLLAKLWNAMGLASLLPAGTSSVSLPAAFFVGLVAATGSCLALVGGLLLSVSAAWAEETQGMSTEKRLRPMTLFNVGRLAGYFVFGGLVGLLGMVLNPGGQITGYVTIILSFVMIALALRVLNLLPNALCRLPNDKWSKGLRSLSESRHPFMPFVLGALTFFVPCGFTQSMQLLALGTGSFFAGGMLMLVFALGTLPSLLGITLAGAFVRGRALKYFYLFSGVTVLLLGVNNLQSGLLLTGVDAKGFVERQLFTAVSNAGKDPYVTIDAQGRQIIAMYVTPEGYKPNRFAIQKNRETWIYAVAEQQPQGCGNFMQIPTLHVSTIIRQGGNWLGPITPEAGDFVVTCSQGILRADVHVE